MPRRPRTAGRAANYFSSSRSFSPRTITRVPQLQLADNNSELNALADPTLFALPNARDFSSAIWPKIPAVPVPAFRYTEPPRVLAQPDAQTLGATFNEFMQTNRFAAYELDFKPEPQFTAPAMSMENSLPQNSTLQIVGGLAQRKLLSPVSLPDWPHDDVIVSSKIRALVDTAGNVVSVILLPPETVEEISAHDDGADQRALAFARGLRFAPAQKITLGVLIFNWHTVPVISTNAPDNR